MARGVAPLDDLGGRDTAGVERVRGTSSPGQHPPETQLFNEARAIGNEFQDALTKLLFHSDADLIAATQRYGVF